MALLVFEKEIPVAQYLTKTEQKNAGIWETNCSMDVFYFLRSIRKKKKKASVYILKPCREIGQSFAESLRGCKLVKDLEVFWMNNKTINIIEFGFLSMWRIM